MRYSSYDWNVFIDSKMVCARLTSDKQTSAKEQPSFLPQADPFRSSTQFLKVENGWLIGFNRGEWGGALYWFSPDGKQNYKISSHQIVVFYRLRDGIYAAEGLARLGISRGSILQIKQTMDSSWRARPLVKLPSAPSAVSVRTDDLTFLTLTDSLVFLGPDRKIKTIVPDAIWSYFYPNSSVLSPIPESSISVCASLSPRSIS